MAIPQKKKAPTALIDKAIHKFRALYVPYKRACKLKDKLEAKVDEQKARVIGLFTAAGLDSYESPYGKISLQQKDKFNWKGYREDLFAQLKDKGIDVAAQVDLAELEKKHTTEGDVYIAAPQAWSGKAG